MIKYVSTYVWLLLVYLFAQYAHLNLDMPFLDMEHIIYKSTQYKHYFVTTKDVFVLIGIFLLFIEVYKAATEGEYNHIETIISFITATIYLAIFLNWEKAHTVEFLMLTLMTFIDAIGGFLISINAARKDINVS